jgi:hypothetical protein
MHDLSEKVVSRLSPGKLFRITRQGVDGDATIIGVSRT